MANLFALNDWIDGIKAGDRKFLAKAITLVESSNQDDRQHARQLLSALNQPALSLRIGITGPPGVGKSSLIEVLGQRIIAEDKKVAVLSIDPSSTLTGGSILGDKTRMLHLSQSERAFIRPSPSGQQLGGIARSTRDVIRICEAAGFDYVMIETAGIGQTEYLVSTMTDLTILLNLPGSGDELQAMKRGIMEWADILIVHKADEPQQTQVVNALRDLNTAAHFFSSKDHGWPRKVMAVSSKKDFGITELWSEIQVFQKHIINNNYILNNRNQQLIDSFRQQLKADVWDRLTHFEAVQQKLVETEARVQNLHLSPEEAVEILEDFIFAYLRR